MVVSGCWGGREQRQRDGQAALGRAKDHQNISVLPRPSCLIRKMQKWKPMGAQGQPTQPGSSSTGLWVPVHPAFPLYPTGQLRTGPSSARLASDGSSLGNKHF